MPTSEDYRQMANRSAHLAIACSAPQRRTSLLALRSGSLALAAGSVSRQKCTKTPPASVSRQKCCKSPPASEISWPAGSPVQKYRLRREGYGHERRDFIPLLGGAVAAWPLAARAQQGDRMRRVGVFVYLAADDPEGSARLGAFRQGLQALDGRRTVTLGSKFVGTSAIRTASAPPRRSWSGSCRGDPDLRPAGVAALRRETRSIPIVFTQVTNPLGAGFVTSMARPGGNITGFSSFELSIAGKWLEVLKELRRASSGSRSFSIRIILAKADFRARLRWRHHHWGFKSSPLCCAMARSRNASPWNARSRRFRGRQRAA